jgi:hypothetical protein
MERVGAFCAIAVAALVLFGIFGGRSDDEPDEEVESAATASATATEEQQPGRPSNRSGPVSGY